MSEVKVRIGADTRELEQGVSRSKKALADLRGELREGITTAAQWGVGMAAAGAAAFTALASKGLQAVDAQAKLARQLSTTTGSVATLSRAAELSGISMEQVSSGVRQFTVRLAQATSGTGPAADALKTLGISAQELSAVPLDQRLEQITSAIQETIPASQQAAVAAQLFGERAGLAFAQLNPEVLAQARAEAELFGTAISAVDAAKVEAANDAFSTLNLALKGVSNRIAIELAPILTALSQMFVQTAKDAGGFGQATTESFNGILQSIGFTMDAMEGLKRSFQVAGRFIAVTMLEAERSLWSAADSIINGPVEAINLLIDAMNNIPGVDIERVGLTGFGESARENMALAEEAIRIGAQDIQDILMAPMPSHTFDNFVQQAREASAAAAQAIMESQGDSGNLSGLLLGGETDEEKEKRREALEAKVEAIRQANLSELEALDEKLIMEQEILAAARENELIDEEKHKEMLADIDRKYQDELTNIEQKGLKQRETLQKQHDQNVIKMRENVLNQSVALLQALAGESKIAAIASIALTKGMAIAQTLAHTQTAAMLAYASQIIPGDPTSVVRAQAAYAKTQTLGKISAGLIAATGLAQAAGVGGGGGGGVAGGFTGGTGVQGQTDIFPGSMASQSREPDRSVSVTVSLIGGTDRDQMVASSILEQINAEIERGGRISRVGIA